ncbi:MAG: ribonuclease III domain-containing protein [Lachnospiraceae bacterium]|nr:ribonuclease III domain-containing protein [Lachnospiraceae bacterium]
MEESISLLRKLKETFQCSEVDIKTYSPLTLAYIGDGIYDLFIRTIIVERGNRAANELHKSTSRIVNAGTQALMIAALTDTLTEEELSVYKRGRNAKSYTSAKNATIGDYRKATGFEALMGFLYLTDQTDRAMELVKIGLEKIAVEI